MLFQTDKIILRNFYTKYFILLIFSIMNLKNYFSHSISFCVIFTQIKTEKQKMPTTHTHECSFIRCFFAKLLHFEESAVVLTLLRKIQLSEFPEIYFANFAESHEIFFSTFSEFPEMFIFKIQHIGQLEATRQFVASFCL